MKDVSVQLTRMWNRITSQLRAVKRAQLNTGESLRHQSPVNSILILLTKCCPEIESNHRVWTGSSSPNGLPLAIWNKAQSVKGNITIHSEGLYCMAKNVLSIIATALAYLQRSEELCSKKRKDYLLTPALNPPHYFLSYQSLLTCKGHGKQKLKSWGWGVGNGIFSIQLLLNGWYKGTVCKWNNYPSIFSHKQGQNRVITCMA